MNQAKCLMGKGNLGICSENFRLAAILGVAAETVDFNIRATMGPGRA